MVSRPPSMRSMVAIWRASCGGQTSPMRVAISRRMRRSKGAMPAANAVVSMPSS